MSASLLSFAAAALVTAAIGALSRTSPAARETGT
jgi:hypothetical protein